MNIYENLVTFKQPSAVALGYFDGIHIGHRKVISQTAGQGQFGLTPLVFTFTERPYAVLSNKESEYLITRQDKTKILDELNISVIYYIDFKIIKNLTAEEFTKQILFKVLNAKKIFCGNNHRFGKGGIGNVNFLETFGQRFGMEVCAVPSVDFNGEQVSSSNIRELIKNGCIEEANRLLFKPFGFEGIVIQGNNLGKKMNIPTMNQQIPEAFTQIKFGVYASVSSLRGVTYKSITNVGQKPTVGNYLPLCETLLLDYTGSDFYGESVDLRLTHFLREEKKFGSLQALQTAINKDIQVRKHI